MIQIVLAAMLAGYLAISPGPESRPLEQRRSHRKSEPVPNRLETNLVMPAAAKRVLILDQPFEPTYAYIRIDNAVYALRLS